MTQPIVRGQTPDCTPAEERATEAVARQLVAHYSLLLRNPIPDDSPGWLVDARRIARAALAAAAEVSDD